MCFGIPTIRPNFNTYKNSSLTSANENKLCGGSPMVQRPPSSEDPTIAGKEIAIPSRRIFCLLRCPVCVTVSPVWAGGQPPGSSDGLGADGVERLSLAIHYLSLSNLLSNSRNSFSLFEPFHLEQIQARMPVSDRWFVILYGVVVAARFCGGNSNLPHTWMVRIDNS